MMPNGVDVTINRIRNPTSGCGQRELAIRSGVLVGVLLAVTGIAKTIAATSCEPICRGIAQYGIVDIGLQYDRHAALMSDYFSRVSPDTGMSGQTVQQSCAGQAARTFNKFTIGGQNTIFADGNLRSDSQTSPRTTTYGPFTGYQFDAPPSIHASYEHIRCVDSSTALPAGMADVHDPILEKFDVASLGYERSCCSTDAADGRASICWTMQSETAAGTPHTHPSHHLTLGNLSATNVNPVFGVRFSF